MYKIKNYLMIVVALMALNGCSVTKKLSKQKDKVQSKLDSIASLVEKSKTNEKITEEADTTAQVKGFDSKISTPMAAINDKPLVFDNGDIKTTISKDSAGNLKVDNQVKDRSVTYKFKKEVTRSITSSKSSQVEKKEEKKESKTFVDKSVKRSGLPGWSWILLILALLAATYLTLRKRFAFSAINK